MSRRRSPEKRELAPDPRYGDLMVTKFINYTMKGREEERRGAGDLSGLRYYQGQVRSGRR